MGKRARVLALLLCLGALIPLTVVFQRFVLAAIIVPTASVVWLFLRLTVLSIGQEAYWWGALCLLPIVILARLSRGLIFGVSRVSPGHSYTARDQVSVWRSSILLGEGAALGEGGTDVLRRDLMWLFTGMYASRTPGSVHYKIREAFQSRLIPLPEPIFTFLYAERHPEPSPPVLRHPVLRARQVLLSARGSLRAWIRRKTGGARNDYFASIEEVVAFMEAFLEMKHDNTTQPTDA